jgi:hypothetical protein
MSKHGEEKIVVKMKRRILPNTLCLKEVKLNRRLFFIIVMQQKFATEVYFTRMCRLCASTF